MTEVPADHNVVVSGLNIHYLDWGGSSTKNLLLVHGQGGNAHNWDHIASELRGEFRVIAIDQRGHGDSDHTWEGYGVAQFGSDLAEFVEKVGIAPCDYVGLSLGARNGIAYAGDHSDHLKHFVCLDYGPEMSVASARSQISRRQVTVWPVPVPRAPKGSQGRSDSLLFRATPRQHCCYTGATFVLQLPLTI